MRARNRNLEEQEMRNGVMLLRLNEPMRGGPIEMIGRGDLAQPYVRTLWQRFCAMVDTIVSVARESRELERRLISERGYRGFRES